MTDFERRAQRMRRIRFWIRAEFAVAIAAVLIVALAVIAAPGTMGPGMYETPPPVGPLMPWVAVAGIIVGLVAMIRLSRIDPESGERTWRYRG